MVAAAAVPVARAAGTVAQRAWTWAKANMPAVAANADAYLQKAGKSAEQLLPAKSPTTQSAVVTALFKSGFPARDFVEVAQLTEEEARQYAQIVAKYRVEQSNMVDQRQAPKTSTGDAYIDQISIDLDIRDNCQVLGISSDQYAKLIRGINTHTTADIERFQLGRRLRGEKAI